MISIQTQHRREMNLLSVEKIQNRLVFRSNNAINNKFVWQNVNVQRVFDDEIPNGMLSEHGMSQKLLFPV